MISSVCQRFCSFYRPGKDEPEKCLGFTLLARWSQAQPGLPGRLATIPAAGGTADLAEVAARVCRRCAFRRHGCDFARGLPRAVPCGGLLALAGLAARDRLGGADVDQALGETLKHGYLRLAEHVSLKRLETPCLYDRLADELYELNDEAFAFVAKCDGTVPGLARQADPEFLGYLLEESLLACLASPARRVLEGRSSPIPSLRHLELLLTDRCNLRCAHCYLGEAGSHDLPLEAVWAALREFADLQGLRVLLSGGEPLLHPAWGELNARLPEFEVRAVLLTNGTLLSPAVVQALRVQEVQVSLDGLEAGHQRLRGPGTWGRAVAGLQRVQDRGLEVSVATMIHAGNLQELPDLGEVLKGLGVREWRLDVPCQAGRLPGNPELWVSPAEAAPFLDLAFGEAAHGAAPGWTCGRHLAAVLPTGEVAKCGLYAHRPLGRLEEGLETCWLRLTHHRVSDLTCAACEQVQECRGGCRFRAGEGLGPDPVMCARFGVDPASF